MYLVSSSLILSTIFLDIIGLVPDFFEFLQLICTSFFSCNLLILGLAIVC